MRFGASEWASGLLSIVGALNWGLIGLFGFNLVHTLFGWSKPVERLVYATVGLAAILFSIGIAREVSESQETGGYMETRRPGGMS